MDYKDGDILRGGFTITLDTAGLTLIVDSASPNYPSNVVSITDENDKPSAQDIYDGLRTANLTVQINRSADQGDYRGDTFTSPGIDGTSRKWVIVNQGGQKTKREAVTYDLTVNEVINP